ncbi:MAG: DegV family protein [Thermacetogeniaceae bacterium]|jgi:DegV family protein with EDD domain
MGKIGIVTDSVTYLTPEQIDELQVEVVSLVINFGDQSWPEASVSDYRDFYEQLRQVSYLPTTSQPSMGDFLQTYDRLAGKVSSIISIHLSAGVSGTVQVARSAARMMPGVDISVVDSGAAAIGVYMMVDAAARAVAAGWEKERVLQALEYIKENRTLLFMPDSLEYLKRGGRIGGAAAMVGTLLQVKPILYFNPGKNGTIDVYEKIRTKEKGLQRILAELDRAYRQSPDLKTGVVHVGAEAEGKALVQRVRELYPELSPDLCPVGPVVGAHIGPGTLGICCYPLTSDLKEIIKYKQLDCGASHAMGNSS